jgi:hypothetical protein
MPGALCLATRSMALVKTIQATYEDRADSCDEEDYSDSEAEQAELNELHGLLIWRTRPELTFAERLEAVFGCSTRRIWTLSETSSLLRRSARQISDNPSADVTFATHLRLCFEC